MRHGVKLNHLGRTTSHRKAMLSNMASSLLKHKKIVTTVAKAKALRVYVEPMITKSKSDSVHNRRTVFSYLRDKEAIQELFGPIAEKIADRPGGYTRILKLGTRMGDNAEMAMIELVDYNEFMPAKTAKTKKKSTRRGKTAKATETTKEVVEETATEAVVETETPEISENPTDQTSTDESTEETK